PARPHLQHGHPGHHRGVPALSAGRETGPVSPGGGAPGTAMEPAGPLLRSGHRPHRPHLAVPGRDLRRPRRAPRPAATAGPGQKRRSRGSHPRRAALMAGAAGEHGGGGAGAHGGAAADAHGAGALRTFARAFFHALGASVTEVEPDVWYVELTPE